jgi:hypothetical protein
MALSKYLDEREQWCGIKRLRKQHQPIPYSSRDRQGRHVEMKDRVEEAAKFLANEVWGLPGVEAITKEERWPRRRYPMIVRDPLGINVSGISLEEVRAAVRTLKRRKTFDSFLSLSRPLERSSRIDR